MATVHTNGVDLRVNRYWVGPRDEDRPVVVFVHGLGIVDHSGLSFTLGMPLANVADVVLYALRGHGRSEVPPTGYRLDDHVADLAGLLDALAVDAPVHLVGCSYGGAIATRAAMLHGDRVGSVFLLDPLFSSPGWTMMIRAPMEASAAILRREHTTEEIMDLLGLTSRRKADAVEQRATRFLLGTSVLDDLQAEADLGADDYAAITCPLTAVFGTGSMMYPLEPVLQDYVPHAVIHEIEGVDHLGIFSLTREVGQLIGDHVARVAPGTAPARVAPVPVAPVPPVAPVVPGR